MTRNIFRARAKHRRDQRKAQNEQYGRDLIALGAILEFTESAAPPARPLAGLASLSDVR
jgi:hypothetical protein